MKEIEKLARCFEGARVSYNDKGTLYISFNMSFERIAFKKIVDLFYPGKYKTEDIADWNFGVRVSDNNSPRFEEVAERMKEFAWTVEIDRSAGEIVLKDLTITYYAFAKWWEDHRCADFEPQYGLNDREVVLKYNG